uniref:hypothetical protein n=1 Tax=Schaalia suimastitidis TaxID=121163 RepID=UPI000551FF7F
YKEVAPDTYDIDSIVRGQLIDISTSEYYSQITDLGTRTIGGATARGYSFTEIFDGISHRTEQWHVGRHDGLWTIQLSSADNDTTLPPEIYDILNTITWATPTPLTFTTTTGTADTVTATLPADWKEIPRRTYDPASYVASPNGIGNASVPSIRLLRTHPGDLSSTYGQITLDTYDLGYIVNRTINDIQNDSMYSNIADLGTRTINDTTARGYTFIKTVDGISHRYEIWELGRHDGLWTIQLRSALNDTTLPPEIYDILTTITWTTPTR